MSKQLFLSVSWPKHINIKKYQEMVNQGALGHDYTVHLEHRQFVVTVYKLDNPDHILCYRFFWHKCRCQSYLARLEMTGKV